MSCKKECTCGNAGHLAQDVLEFISIATNLGWTDEHSNLLIEFENENDEWEDASYFSKERHCAHLRGYLHASEQTEMQINEWKARLEGWAHCNKGR